MFSKTQRNALIVLGILCLGLSFASAARKDKTKKAEETAAATVTKSEVPAVKVLADFEKGLGGWVIPDWQKPKADNATVSVALYDDPENGIKAIDMSAKFLEGQWSGAYVEIEKQEGDYLSFMDYNTLLCDVYLPERAPADIRGEFILTVGPDWTWTEMREALPIKAGNWYTIKVDVSPASVAWKTRLTDDIRGDVRKLGIRISSDGIPYTGPVYIDNVRLEATSAN